MEGNLANEVGLIVLDMIELFCNHFKVRRQCFIVGTNEELLKEDTVEY